MLVAINQRSLAWLGPSRAADVWTDFMSYFRRHVVRDADVFKEIDIAENRLAYKIHLGGKARLTPLASATAGILDFFPTAKSRQRMEQYLKLVQEKPTGFLSGGLVVDPKQNPLRHARATAWMPTITRSTRPVWVHSESAARGEAYTFTPAEVAFSQGWPTLETSRNGFMRRAVEMPFTKFTPSQQFNLLGNAMHLPALASFVFWVLANCVRRDVIAEFLPPLTLLKVTSAESDDDKTIAGESGLRSGSGSGSGSSETPAKKPRRSGSFRRAGEP